MSKWIWIGAGVGTLLGLGASTTSVLAFNITDPTAGLVLGMLCGVAFCMAGMVGGCLVEDWREGK